MPTTETNQGTESDLRAARIRAAITDHLGCPPDYEGRTSLDELIAEVTADRARKNAWEAALVDVARTLRPEQGAWWPALETFTVMTGLAPPTLADVLEDVIARQGCTDPRGRASVYGLLGAFGKAPTAVVLVRDLELKQSFPVMWLDLILPVLPDIQKRQRFVLEAVQAGNFTVEHFGQRLDDMRELAGRQLAHWLKTLREAFPPGQRATYDTIVNEAFDPEQQPIVETNRPKRNSRAKKSLSQAPALRGHIANMLSWKQRNADMTPTLAAA